jgi:preprotein translocase subunit SecD
MSLLGATLTLPGIAGIVLTVGMAVDANVLIFSRIREELAAGLSPQGAISAGYDRAFVSILDANITTLIVALILYAIGSGPVQGFAVTLSIGILTSMFTSIVMTRGVVNLVYGGRKVDRLWI